MVWRFTTMGGHHSLKPRLVCVSRKKLSSARSRRAPWPPSTVKRLPESLLPRSKSRMSRSVPRSQWALNSKPSALKSRGVPQRRRSTFSVSSTPTGVAGQGMLGRCAMKSKRSSSISVRFSFRPSILSLTWRTASLAASASSLLPSFMRAPIFLDSALRVACSSSTSPITERRSSSSSKKRSRSQLAWRLAMASSTASGFSLTNLMSSMVLPLVAAPARLRRAMPCLPVRAGAVPAGISDFTAGGRALAAPPPTTGSLPWWPSIYLWLLMTDGTRAAPHGKADVIWT